MGYGEVAAKLREQIRRGRWQPGDQLPTAVELAEEYETSRETVLRAFRELKREGLLRVTQGAGTFVRDQTRQPVASAPQVRRDWHGYYFDLPSQSWVLKDHHGIHRIAAPSYIAEWLGTEDVVVRDRDMGEPDEPVTQLAASYVPAWLVEQLPIVGQADTGPGGILDRIEEHFGKLRWVRYRFADLASPREARRMIIDDGAAVLRTATVTLAPDDTAVEVTVRTRAGTRFMEGPTPVPRHSSAAYPRSGQDRPQT